MDVQALVVIDNDDIEMIDGSSNAEHRTISSKTTLLTSYDASHVPSSNAEHRNMPSETPRLTSHNHSLFGTGATIQPSHELNVSLSCQSHPATDCNDCCIRFSIPSYGLPSAANHVPPSTEIPPLDSSEDPTFIVGKEESVMPSVLGRNNGFTLIDDETEEEKDCMTSHSHSVLVPRSPLNQSLSLQQPPTSANPINNDTDIYKKLLHSLSSSTGGATERAPIRGSEEGSQSSLWFALNRHCSTESGTTQQLASPNSEKELALHSLPHPSREGSLSNEVLANAMHVSGERQAASIEQSRLEVGSDTCASKPSRLVEFIKDDRDTALLSIPDEEYFLAGSSTEDGVSSVEELSSTIPLARSIEGPIDDLPSLTARQKTSSVKRRQNPSGSKAKRKPPITERRNRDTEAAMEKLDLFDHDGINIREKVTVELDDEDFLHIVVILQCTETGDVFVRGQKLRRTRYMNGMFDNKKNEVCWIQELDDDDPRPSQAQSMETIPVTQIIKRRRLRFTNQAYPALNYRDEKGWIIPGDDDPNKKAMYEVIEKHAPLTCRMKFVRYFKDAWARRRNICYEKVVFFIRQDECDNGPDNKVSDLQLRQMWRGKTECGGAQVGLVPGEKEFLRQEALSHAGRQCNNSLLISDRKYKPGSVMTRGAVGDLLIRDDDAGVIYQKLSGVNDACFTRSTLNVVTGKEVNDSKASNDELNVRIRDALRGIQSKGGAFYLVDDKHRPNAQSSTTRRMAEVIEVDAHWRSTTDELIYQQRIEGGMTKMISPRLPETQKRTASEALTFPTNLGKTSDPGLRKTSKDDRTIDLADAAHRSCTHQSPLGIPRPSTPTSPSGDTTRMKPFDLTGTVTRSSALEPAFGDMTWIKPESTFGTKLYDARYGRGFGKATSGDSVLNQQNGSEESKSASSYSRQGAPTGHRSGKSKMTTPSAKSKSIQRRYTFGDCFCGAGGMSRGAVMAGLRVKWGFDFNDIACYSYALTFISARVYHEQVNIFATSRAIQKVDICHISPPCQFFSSAHTIACSNDELNTACFFAVGELLNKTKCRVAVLEQTAGLMNRHEQYFHTCVREFTLRGFNVRWRIINCADFGLPQRRMRLFMIASCPGEPLPPFPKPTHAEAPPEGSALKPWVTINQAIAKIPEGWANHDIEDMPLCNELPDSGDKVANCVTTSGGEKTLHPSGTRSFTHREFACLQGFPLGHKFGPMEIRKQIGNAVAPIVGEAVLREIVRTLRETDERVEAMEGEAGN